MGEDAGGPRDWDKVLSYQKLARAIIQGAVNDVQCPRATPMTSCRKLGCKSCPLCRELALVFLRSGWAHELAEMVGMDADRWEVCVRELERQAMVKPRAVSG